MATESLVQVKGAVVKEPELRKLTDGRSVCTVVMPLDAHSNGVDPKPYWLQIIAFGDLADKLNTVRMGQTIVVSGRFSASRWLGKDGISKASLGVIINRAGLYESFAQGVKWFEVEKRSKEEQKDEGVEKLIDSALAPGVDEKPLEPF